MSNVDHAHDSFVFKSDRPWPNPRLKVSAIVGHTTQSSARLWFRTASPGQFSVFLFDWDASVAAYPSEQALLDALGPVPLTTDQLQARLTRTRREDFEIEDFSTDTTHVVDWEGLDPDTDYGYLLYSHRETRVLLGQNRLRRFRTPAPESERRKFQFAAFSCHMPYNVQGLFRKRVETHKTDMWYFLESTLQRHRDEIDLVIAGGDQCYSDGIDPLNIWMHLNNVMRKESGALLPDQESIVSWYRDIYRGYWGFDGLQRVFDAFPMYMIWDDHEIADGWGSHYFDRHDDEDGLRRMLPGLEDKGLSFDDGVVLVERMFEAAKQVYLEYQHSHNPPTASGDFDYAFRRGGCAFYVLDGRGHRDVSRDSHRILGREQLDRFLEWVSGLDAADTPFLFVVSAVPMVHTRAVVVNADEYLGSLGDDLRDSWEHELHDEERGALLRALFDAADRGINVSIVSGDVHVSAVFSMEDDRGNRIYQLTSSAMTYDLSRLHSWVLTMGAADDGETHEGYRFRRLALYTEGSYVLVSVDPRNGEAWFKLYSDQKLKVPPGIDGHDRPVTHSITKIRLF